MAYQAADPADGAGGHPMLRAAPGRHRGKISFMTKAWEAVNDVLTERSGWVKGMTMRSTGTDGVLFVENPEKNDGHRIVRVTIATAMPTVDTNDAVLTGMFSMGADEIALLRDKIKTA